MSCIGPQTIDLNLADLISVEQNHFYLLGMMGCFSQKGQDRILFDAFGTANAADTSAFRQQYQAF